MMSRIVAQIKIVNFLHIAQLCSECTKVTNLNEIQSFPLVKIIS